MTISEKILIISDVHARVKDMNEFFDWIINKKGEKIQFAVSLGDFWSGRNYYPHLGKQVRDFWTDLNYLEDLNLPIFHLKGNEDLDKPNHYWHSACMWLMKDQEIFNLDKYKVLPIHYLKREQLDQKSAKHPEFSDKDKFDILLCHQPPHGILDSTLHSGTHKIIKGTGSPLIRKYVDTIKPRLSIFGHIHFSNLEERPHGLVCSIDKLVRESKWGKSYSYALIDPNDDTIEVVWKSRDYFKYNFGSKKMIFHHQRSKKL